MSNRYLFCRYGHEPVELDIYDYTDPFDDVFLTYWIRTLRCLETKLKCDDLTFCIVWNSENIRDLPVYGNDVVVIALMDEFCQIPTYFEKVLYVFKAYGFAPYVHVNRANASVSVLAKLARDSLRWVYGSGLLHLRLRSEITHERGGMVVPLGYARQTDLPGKTFEERRYLVSFIGSMRQRPYHPLSLRALLGTPKDIARSRMAQELEKLALQMPNDVLLADTGFYLDGARSDGVGYSELMADTKICLAPRGSSPETFRLFEAMRQGCVVVCDRVPNHWFFEGCPIVEIDDWRKLHQIVANLTAETQQLQELHERSLAWWTEKCSEPALAAVMASRLKRQMLRCCRRGSMTGPTHSGPRLRGLDQGSTSPSL